MQAIPLITAIGSMAFSAMGAAQQASQQRAAYEYQAQVDRNNAQIAEWNARDQQKQGEADIETQHRKTAALLGNQRATFASRGIDLSEGSAFNILSDTAYWGDKDVMTISDNTAKNVWATRIQQQNDLSNAALKEQQAQSFSPGKAAVGSLLSNAGTVASTWYRDKGAIKKSFA